MKNLIFVDCEASGPCPGLGELTEFGAVEFATRQTFHGVLAESAPDPENPALSIVTGHRFDPVAVFSAFEAWLLTNTDGHPAFVSDNPAYDFQWINYGFHHALGRNPFGHSGRRIGDFYAGLRGDFAKSQQWEAPACHPARPPPRPRRARQRRSLRPPPRRGAVATPERCTRKNRVKHGAGHVAGSMREGEGWSVCGAPLGLGESIGKVWGDALVPIYATPAGLDSSDLRRFAECCLGDTASATGIRSGR